MSKVFDFSGANDLFPGKLQYHNPKESTPILSLDSDVYFPLRKRFRVNAPYVVSGEPKEQPSIEVLPDECLFEVFRRLPGGQERSTCACVSKRWLMLLSTIKSDEICIAETTELVDLESRFDLKKEENSPKPQENGEFGNDSEDLDEIHETDSHGHLSRCLEGKKATDVRLAAIAVGTASRGGLGKLSIRGSVGTRGLTNLGLKAISRGCASLRSLSLWNLHSIDDEGLCEIASGVHSLEKLDLSRCPAITDKGLAAIASNCLKLTSVTIDSCSNIGNDSLEALGRYCRNLKSITIKNCPLVGDKGVATLFSLAGNVLAKANFQALNITDMSLAVIGHYGKEMTDLALIDLQNVNERGFWVMGMGQGLQQLRSLLITACGGVSDLGLEALKKGCPNLKLFGLRKCPLISDNGVVSFVKATSFLESLQLDECHRITQFGVFGILSNCGEKLKAFALSNCFGTRDLDFGFPLMSSCHSLRSVTIRNCPGFGDSGLGMLGKLCPELTHVDLSGLHGITDAGFLPLVQKSEAGLKKVNLTGCVNLSDNVVISIAKFHGETIETLNLDGCKNVTDASLVAIAQECSVLSELDVSQSKITDSGVAVLASAEQLNLQILSLAGCSFVSDKSLYFLKVLGKTLMGLNIKNCRGINCDTVDILLEHLWRCDILS